MTDLQKIEYLKELVFAQQNDHCFIERERFMNAQPAPPMEERPDDFYAKLLSGLLDSVSTPIDENDYFVGRVIEGPTEGDGPCRFGDGKIGIYDGIIDTVVNVKGGAVTVSHTGAANVGFVRQDQRGGKGADGNARSLVMVSDGGGDCGNFIGREAELVKQAKCHDRAALAVLDPIDQISDVMQKACDPCKLDGTRGITKSLQNPPRTLGNTAHVGKIVLGVSERQERLIGGADIGTDCFVGSDFPIRHLKLLFTGSCVLIEQGLTFFHLNGIMKR